MKLKKDLVIAAAGLLVGAAIAVVVVKLVKKDANVEVAPVAAPEVVAPKEEPKVEVPVVEAPKTEAPKVEEKK